ncbi:hypothetical protein C6P42_003116 [Pichia californica]|nr:hypothetical protein C6P42_003116 [[Candida] californica]
MTVGKRGYDVLNNNNNNYNNNNNNNNENTKRQHRGVIRPGFSLPAKPVFLQSNNNIRHSAPSPSTEVFPGMMVNLPSESNNIGEAVNGGNYNGNNNYPMKNQDTMPSTDALQLFSTIIGTLQQQQQQAPQQQNQNQQPRELQQSYIQLPYQNQHSYQQQYQINTNPNTYPQQHYQNNFNSPHMETYNQNEHKNFEQNQSMDFSMNSNLQQFNNNNSNGISNGNNNQPNAAFLSVFNQFVQAYSSQQQQQNQQQYATINDTTNYNTNQSQLQNQSQFPNSFNNQPKKVKTKNNKKKKEIKEVNEQINKEKSSDEDDLLLDDEADWEKKVAIQGTNIVFENDEDIQKWIEERKKNWPTNKRVEDKRKEIENAKKIVENLNNQNATNDGSKSKVKMCNFWVKNGRCKNGKKCKYSHDMTNYSKPADNNNNKNRSNTISTRPLKNHKVKLIHGIPVQIPSRFIPLQNEGKSLHKLMVEGEQFQKENVQLLGLFSKMVKYGIVKNDWGLLKKKLKLDDQSLNMN